VVQTVERRGVVWGPVPLDLLFAEKELGSGWDVGRVQRTLLKTAVRVTRAGRRLIVDTALSAVPLWSCLLERISKWTLPTKLHVPKRHRRQWVAPPRHAFLVPVLRQ